MGYRFNFPDPQLLQAISNAKMAIDRAGGIENISRKSEEIRRVNQMLEHNKIPLSLIKEYIRIVKNMKPSLDFLSTLSKLRIKKNIKENMFSQYISDMVSDDDVDVFIPRTQYSDTESPRGPPHNLKKKFDLSFVLFLFTLLAQAYINICISYYLEDRTYIFNLFMSLLNILLYLKNKK